MKVELPHYQLELLHCEIVAKGTGRALRHRRALARSVGCGRAKVGSLVRCDKGPEVAVLNLDWQTKSRFEHSLVSRQQQGPTYSVSDV